MKNLTDNSPGVKLHLSFLKWNLGVGEKTSNAAVWVDLGRYSLVIKISKQVLSYFDRLGYQDIQTSIELL